MMQFKVCGPLRVSAGDVDLTPTAPKVRRVLALLLLRANQPVSVDAVVDELWGNEPPARAIATVQTYVYQLRRALDAHQAVAGGAPWLITAAPGYQLRIDPAQLDLHAFESLSWTGRQLLDAGQTEEAARTLRAALEVWSGAGLANIVAGELLQPYLIRLEEQRLRTLELRILADLQLGQHAELIAELRSLVAMYPLNEWFHGRLMEALSLTGRRSEALQAYQDLRSLLNDQLGIDPQPEIQRLQRKVLSYGDPRPEPRQAPAFRPALATA